MIIPKNFLLFTALSVTALSDVAIAQEESCLNKRGNFKVKGVRYNCLDVRTDRSLCYAHKKFKNKCPGLCKEENCNCKDSTAKFYSKMKGNQLRCKKVARKAEELCKDADARMMCPETCGMCFGSLTVAPTSAPDVTCVVEARLGFQELVDIPYNGSHSDR